MKIDELMVQVENCAAFFYQNREKEAHELLNQILPNVNQELQSALQIFPEYQSAIINTLAQFLEAYQLSDHLALADLLEYPIFEILQLKKQAGE